MNEHHFLAVGVFGNAEPTIASLDAPPYVDMVRKPDAAWIGMTPGTKLRVTYIKTRPESETCQRTIPRSVLCVVAV